MKVLEKCQTTWQYWHEFSGTHCMHGPNCQRRKQGQECHWGGRHAEVQMISGAVLPIWKVGWVSGGDRFEVWAK